MSKSCINCTFCVCTLSLGFLVLVLIIQILNMVFLIIFIPSRILKWVLIQRITVCLFLFAKHKHLDGQKQQMLIPSPEKSAVFISFFIFRWEFSVEKLIGCTDSPKFCTCRTSMWLDNITDGGCRRYGTTGQRTRRRRVNKLHLLLLIAPSARTNSCRSVRHAQ